MASLGNYKWAERGCNTAPSVWGILSQLGRSHHSGFASSTFTSTTASSTSMSSTQLLLHSSSVPLYHHPLISVVPAAGDENNFLASFFSRHSSASWNACQQRNTGLSPYRSCAGLPPGGTVYREVNSALYMATQSHSQEDSGTNLNALPATLECPSQGGEGRGDQDKAGGECL